MGYILINGSGLHGGISYAVARRRRGRTAAFHGGLHTKQQGQGGAAKCRLGIQAGECIDLLQKMKPVSVDTGYLHFR